MALIKGKFIDSNSPLDGTKLKLLNLQPLKGKKSDGSDKEIVKVNAQDKVEFPELPVVSSDPTADNELARKGYVDAQVEAAGQSASADLAAEQSARQSADMGLSGRLDVLEADPTTKAYVDSEMAGSKSYTDGKISDLIGGAPAMLDTLKEISDAISAGSDVATGLANSISQEVSDRQAADLVLDRKITAEQTRATSEEGRIEGKLNQEIADRTTAVANVVQGAQSRLVREIQNRTASEQLIKDSVMAERDRATSEEGRIERELYQEISDRQGAVSGEAAARSAADMALSGRLDVLEADPTTKSYVDGKVAQEVLDRQGAVSAEESARQTADSALSGRLDVLEADPTTKTYVDSGVASAKSYADGKISDLIGGAPAMLDTLKEIADAIENGGSVATGLANQISMVDGQLSQEISDRQAADSAEAQARAAADSVLSGRLNILEADPTTKAYVDGQVAAEATARDAAISVAVMAEQFARELFDTSFDQRLNQEVLDRQAAMVAEQVARDAAVAGLASAIGEELTFVASNLAQETSAREAADVALDARLDSIEAAPHIEGRKEVKTLGAGDLAYVDMAGLALDNTMMVITGGIVHHEGESYTLSTQGSVTRLTFAGDLASGGLNPLAAGDKVYCQYLANALTGGGGGGGGGGGSPNPSLTSVAENADTGVVLVQFAQATGIVVEKQTDGTWANIYGPDVVVDVTGLTSTAFNLGLEPYLLGGSDTPYRMKVVNGSQQSDWHNFSIHRMPEIAINGSGPSVDTLDNTDPQVMSGKAKVIWSFNGTAVAIEGRNWDQAAGQYSEAISVTNLPSPASGILIRYASRTASPQKLLRRLVGANGGRSDWFEIIIPAA